MTTPTDPTIRNTRLAGKLTRLRLELALVMQALRDSSGLTQMDLAERLGVNQPAVAKQERVGDHKTEKVMRHLAEFDADLLVAVKHGEDVIQVSDDDEFLLVALPREVAAWAEQQGKDLDASVLDALRDAHERTRHDRIRGVASSPGS